MGKRSDRTGNWGLPTPGSPCAFSCFRWSLLSLPPSWPGGQSRGHSASIGWWVALGFGPGREGQPVSGGGCTSCLGPCPCPSVSGSPPGVFCPSFSFANTILFIQHRLCTAALSPGPGRVHVSTQVLQVPTLQEEPRPSWDSMCWGAVWPSPGDVWEPKDGPSWNSKPDPASPWPLPSVLDLDGEDPVPGSGGGWSPGSSGGASTGRPPVLSI